MKKITRRITKDGRLLSQKLDDTIRLSIPVALPGFSWNTIKDESGILTQEAEISDVIAHNYERRQIELDRKHKASMNRYHDEED